MEKVWRCPKVTVPDYFRDMTQREHILIGGTTGSGKSVALEVFIFTLLEKAPHQSMLVLIDPKGVELIQFAALPHTLVHATEKEDISRAILWMEREMDVRYAKMSSQRQKKSDLGDIYIIIDEYAVIGGKHGMMSKPTLSALSRIAFKGRASNIHIVACTQRPTRDVIEGLIADNFTTVLALRTKDSQGSRNLIGQKGCESLPLYGEAYYSTPSQKELRHVRIPKIDEDTMATMIEHWINQVEPEESSEKRIEKVNQSGDRIKHQTVIVCPKCGRFIAEGPVHISFCQKCGSRVRIIGPYKYGL